MTTTWDHIDHDPASVASNAAEQRPTIPDIHARMFDHCLTITEAQSEWEAFRAGIPQWHDGGKTRGELARIAQNRWAALRNVAEAAMK